MKEDYDGAEPTASSVSVLNLLTLSHLSEEHAAGWSQKIDETLRLFGERLEQIGRGVPMMAAALSAHAAGPQQIVVIGEGDDCRPDADRRESVPAVCDRRSPDGGAARAASAEALPLVAAMKPVNGKPTAYVCRDFTCGPPATSVEELEQALRS